jgi:hypothetical protein
VWEAQSGVKWDSGSQYHATHYRPVIKTLLNWRRKYNRDQ